MGSEYLLAVLHDAVLSFTVIGSLKFDTGLCKSSGGNKMRHRLQCQKAGGPCGAMCIASVLIFVAAGGYLRDIGTKRKEWLSC